MYNLNFSGHPDELKFMYKQKTQIFERKLICLTINTLYNTYGEIQEILSKKKKKKVAFGKILQEQSPCVLQILPEGKFSYTLTGSDFTDKEGLNSDRVL